MALDPENIRVFGDGEVWIAPFGTTLPTSLNGALNAAFYSMGYITEDGLTVTPETESFEVNAWQAKGPVDIRRTRRTYRIAIPSMENTDTVNLAYFDGGSYSSSGVGERVFTPPDGADFDYWSVVADVNDGLTEQRWVFDKVFLTENEGLTFKKDSVTMFGMTFTCISGADGAAGWRKYETATVVS